jgi:hypothetical protein
MPKEHHLTTIIRVFTAFFKNFMKICEKVTFSGVSSSHFEEKKTHWRNYFYSSNAKNSYRSK